MQENLLKTQEREAQADAWRQGLFEMKHIY